MGSDEKKILRISCSKLYFNPRSPHGERPAVPLAPSSMLTYFNPRSPHGERLLSFSTSLGTFAISIHAPRMGSDDSLSSLSSRFSLFQSTLPAWGATVVSKVAESIVLFQSTLPAWGATLPVLSLQKLIDISIHAPRMGSDYRPFVDGGATKYFNPRSPHGERRCL